MKGLIKIICCILALFICLDITAQQETIKLIPDAKTNITGNQSQQSFSTAASLLYGMPFELSLDVTLTETTAESGPSMNQWGSAILTTGTDPFNTPANGIQVYLHAKGNNGGQLLIAANGQKFFFSNVVYNTDKFNIHLIQSNGQLTMEVTNNAITNGKYNALGVAQTIRYTKPMMFNQIDKLCYAMPTGMNISNLSLTVRTDDMVNYITNIMPKGVGYMNEDTRDYFVNGLNGSGDKLTIYQQFITASTTGGDVAGKRSWQLPEVGKVYTIRGVCQNNTYYWKRNGNDVNAQLTLTATAPDLENFESLFPYLWSPRAKSADDKIALYHATGTGQYLASTGLSQSATTLTNAQEWTISLGTEIGRVAVQGSFANGTRYMAMNRQGTKMGDWPTNGGVYSTKQNDASWSTDYVFEEVPFLVGYELLVTGPASFDPSDVTVRYRQKIVGTEEHETGETAGIVADIHQGGIVFINKEYEESTSIWRLSVSDFTPSEKSGYVAVVTLGNGIIHVEYTQFAALKEKAESEVNAAKSRLDKFAEGALYTQAAIDAAKSGIDAAQALFTDNKPQEACAKLEQTMETFYRTIEGRYVTMTNNTSNILSTTSHTNLSVRTKATASTGDYYGVYQLHYISGGAYQLRNAYYDNYVGQTTSASTVNSASNAVASRWRGTYSFELKKTDESPDAYNLVCTNGAANSLLGVSSTSIAKNSTENPNDAANLWDVRLVDIKTYASAYMGSVNPEAMDGIIGHAPSKAVATALQSGISTCPDRANNPTPEQETTLAGILNYYIDHKEDINKPNIHQYVTFQNRNNTNVYIGENLYEMKVVNTPDLGCVWETLIDEHNRFYFRNVKSGMYMGKVTQSAVGRLTVKDNGANKVEIDITAAPNRTDSEGYVALQDKNTNNYRSYLHYSSDRNAILGWDNTGNASHWTISAVTDEDFISYLKAATANVKSQLSTDLFTYNTLTTNGTVNIPGNYEKSESVRNAANTAATLTWTETNDTAVAHSAYRAAVTAFNDFTTAGTPMKNNEMFLIKTSIELNDQQGKNPAKYFVTQVMDDTGNHTGVEGGSVTNGVPQSAENDFYLFTLWQAVKDGECYKLFNFYTGYYLSKDVSLSDDNRSRYGLTTDPNEAASFIITPQHGCFVSFHRSDYDEMNNGYLFMQTNPSGSRTMFGLTAGNIASSAESARMLFELEPATTEHYEKCLATMLDYQIGTGIGKYTDISGNYESERDKVETLLNAEVKPQDYAEKLKTEAKAFAPILAGLRINLPEAGKYYRIYNTTESQNYYISKATPGSSTMAMSVMTDEVAKNDPNSVFYYDGTYLLAYGNGYYIGNWAPWGQGNLVNGEHQKWAMSFANTGYMGKGKYSIKPIGRSYLYNNKTYGLNGWSAAFNALCEWTLEEVTELPLVVSTAGYSTLFSARDHQIPEGVKCYIATAKKTSDTQVSIVMTKIESGILPANTPVLIKAPAGTYLFTEPDAEAQSEETTPLPYDDNLFAGQIETIMSGHETNEQGQHKFKEYTLQNKQGTGVGFYLYSGVTLAGFKAYLPVEEVLKETDGMQLNAIMFNFNDEETSINATEAFHGTSNDVFYDLSGRRVTNPTSGIYIKNGKKYIIK